jgi:serine/threonine protein kinase
MSDKSIGEEKTVPLGGGGGKGYDLAAGELLGDYEIVKPLGRGGMGQVYLAENRVNGRKVALKLLPADATGTGFVDRFRIESRVMSDLDHPGIVRVHHAGSDKGRYYLTMDYVAGEDGEALTLADVLDGSQDTGYGIKDKGGLDEEQIREIALQICDALAYAHGKGIVHRDLKPANILLENRGQSSEVRGQTLTSTLYPLPSFKIRITDFGLAKVVGEDFVSAMVKKSISLSMGRSIGDLQTDPGSAKRAAYEGTSTGAILGTYDYMSPEQKAGGEVTKQSDIYALGVILYRMLTGRKPEGMAKPPSHFGCSPGWDAIVDKCLEHDFQDRYGDVGEVKAALEGLGKKRRGAGRRGRGVGKKNQTTDGRGWTRMGLGLVAGVLVLLAGWWGMGRDESPSGPVGPSGPQIEATPLATVAPVPEVPVPLPVSPPEGVELVEQVFEVEPAGTRMAVFGSRGLVVQTNVTGRVALRLEPGAYEVELQKDGYELLKQALRVEEGGLMRHFELVPLRGNLQIRSTAGAEVVAVREGSDAPVALGRVGEDGVLRYDRLVEGAYTLRLSHPDYQERSERVEIRKDRAVDLEAPLTGKPGWIWINTSPRAEIWLGTRRLGETGTRIEGIPAGTHTLEIRQSGFRRERVEIVMPPNGFVRQTLPNLSRESGVVRVVLEVPDHAREYFRSSEVEVRVGSEVRNARGRAEWTLEGLPVGRLPVGVESSGFKVQGSGLVEVRDGQTATARFTMEPLPAWVSLTGAPTGASVRLSDGTAVSDLSDVAVPSLRAGTLRVSAPGYQDAEVAVPSLRPGERRSLAVSMLAVQGPVEGQNWRSPETGMEFVWIQPLGMWVGKYEVTNEEYRRMVPGHNSGEYGRHSLNRDRQPVVRVNFDDAKAYAAWMTGRDREAGLLPAGYRYRLPTEQEWETFAKAGRNVDYPWGNQWPPPSGRAGNYHGQEGAGSWAKIQNYNDGHPVTAPVEEVWANPWGLHGVGGNVWEATARDAANSSFGAWRGGSWYGRSQDGLRVSYRGDIFGSNRFNDLGFRLVLSR